MLSEGTTVIQHKHLIINAQIGNAIYDECEADIMLVDLVDFIQMNRLAEPFSKYVKVKGNRGMTAFVPIETSHIAFHIWDEFEPAKLRLDVYTCGILKERQVIQYLDDYFNFISYDWMLLDRETGIDMVSFGQI